MAAPTLTDFTYQFTDAGLVLNSDASLTQPFADVARISGLDSAPARNTTKPSEGQDGGTVEADYEDIRTIVIEGTLYNVTEAYLDTLKSNFAINPTLQPFYLKAPGVVQRVAFCKSLGVRYDVDQARRISMAGFQIQLQAADPVVYSSDVSTTIVGVATPITTGRSYNRLYPLSYGGAVSSGIFFVTNNGNRPVGATFVITGPVNNPTIIDDTLGVQIQVLISLGVSDTLTIDTGNRTVLLNGTANRRSLMTPSSKWFLLQPGSNQLRFTATAVTASQLTLTFRHGWR